MSNYPEIDPSDIRKGDLIRCEWPEDEVFAVEYKAGCDRDHRPTASIHRLIDRPAAPVELPSEPTLGRLTWDIDGQGGSEVAEWMVHQDGVFGGSTRVPVAGVTGFVPGSLVPTSALDELRKVHLAVHNAPNMPPEARNRRRRHALDKFFCAVTEATS